MSSGRGGDIDGDSNDNSDSSDNLISSRSAEDGETSAHSDSETGRVILATRESKSSESMAPNRNERAQERPRVSRWGYMDTSRGEEKTAGGGGGSGQSRSQVRHESPVPSFERPISLEDRSIKRKSDPRGFEDEEIEWKSRAASLDDRKSILSKLVSRQKSMRDSRGDSGKDKGKHTVGLNISSDSDEEGQGQRRSNSSSNKGRQRDKLRSYLMQARSGLPPKEADAVSRSVRQQHVQHYDMELMRRMDSEAFADISRRIGKQCAYILSAPDMATVRKVCSHAQTALSSFGIDQVQLWCGAGAHSGSNVGTAAKGVADVDDMQGKSPDGTTAILRLPHVLKALNAAREEGHYGVYSGDYDDSRGSSCLEERCLASASG